MDINESQREEKAGTTGGGKGHFLDRAGSGVPRGPRGPRGARTAVGTRLATRTGHKDDIGPALAPVQ